MEDIKEKTADEMFEELGYVEHYNPAYAEMFRKDSRRCFGKQIAFNKKTKAIHIENYMTLEELQAINKKCQELRLVRR